MPAYYSVGSRLLTEEMFNDRKSSVVTKILSDADAGRPKLPDLTPPALKTKGPGTAVLGNNPEVDFVPTAVGKPLAIWITSAHAGHLAGSFWRGARSVLVSSAVRSWVTPDAQPRALNILKSRVEKGQPIGLPAATEQGTPLVFYSPAMVDRRLTLTIEFAFDDVDEELFKGVGEIFQAAGGLPVFASASPYLLAASSLFKIGGALGNRLFDSSAEFQATEQIQLALDGESGFSGYVLMTNSTLEASELQKSYSWNAGKLFDKDGNPYQGEVPHVVVAVDGRADTSFEKFSASAVGAALMQKFYNVREDGQTDASTLINALKLYNDFKYGNEATHLQKAISMASENEKSALQLRYDAIVKNIQTEIFKPKS